MVLRVSCLWYQRWNTDFIRCSELNAQLMERYDWIGRRYCLNFTQMSMNELICKWASPTPVASLRIILFVQPRWIIKTHRGVFAGTIIQRYLLPWHRRRDRKVYAVVLSTITTIVDINSTHHDFSLRSRVSCLQVRYLNLHLMKYQRRIGHWICLILIPMH